MPNIRIFDASGQEHALSVSEGETVTEEELDAAKFAIRAFLLL